MWHHKLKLYVITDPRVGDIINAIKLALEGGATAIQLRMKEGPARETVEIGKLTRKLTREYDALLIVNDRIDIAMAIDADGVHLGSNDIPIEDARRIWDGIIGATARTPKDAMNAEKNGADYIGAGSVFPTSTKEDTIVIGVENLKRIVENVNIPVVAIGGINHENAPSVLRTGVMGIAVVSAVMGAKDIKKAANELRKIVDSFI